jgi:DNA-binding NarL/FixJ family response regulator
MKIISINSAPAALARQLRELPKVTPRQAAVLDQLPLTNAQIASVLEISENTVKRHMERAFDALGAPNRAAAALIWHGRRAA